MPVYRAYIVGRHDRSIGVVQLDCIDDESAIKSARRLVDSHDVELWQMDRPVARFDARSKQMCKNRCGRRAHKHGDASPVARDVGLGSAWKRDCCIGCVSICRNAISKWCGTWRAAAAGRRMRCCRWSACARATSIASGRLFGPVRSGRRSFAILDAIDTTLVGLL